MIPYSRQFVDKEDIEAVTEVLKSDYLTQGKIVKIFENAICKKVNAKYAYAMNSATSALHISCISLGLKQGDILWTVPNSFAASANCGLYCGANIDFVDIDKNTYNISVNELEKKLFLSKKNNALPKILVTVDFGGQPVEQEKIYKLSKKYNFKIIEDASHAIGASRNKNMVGCNKYSDITVFSFHPVKIITSAEGGMALTNNIKIADKIDILRTHGITRNINKLKKKNKGIWYYEQQNLGYNYRLSEVHSALGLSQLTKLNKYVKFRNKIAENYNIMLKDLEIQLPHILKNNYSSYHLYVIRINLSKTKKNYKYIFNKLRENGIGVNLHYLPIHLHPYYTKKGFKIGDFPESENYSKEAISIPIFYGITESQQQKVCDKLKYILFN